MLRKVTTKSGKVNSLFVINAALSESSFISRLNFQPKNSQHRDNYFTRNSSVVITSRQCR